MVGPPEAFCNLSFEADNYRGVDKKKKKQDDSRTVNTKNE